MRDVDGESAVTPAAARVGEGVIVRPMTGVDEIVRPAGGGKVGTMNLAAAGRGTKGNKEMQRANTSRRAQAQGTSDVVAVRSVRSEASPERTVRAAAARYVRWLSSMHYADNTVSVRRQHLERLCAWLERRGVVELAQLSTHELAEYRAHLKQRGVSAGSAQSYLVTVRRLCRFLADAGELTEDVAADLDVPRRPRPLPRDVLSHEEAERVLWGIDASTPLGLRDRAMFEVLYSSGLRRAEVLALGVHDVDFAQLLVRVRGGKGGKDRVVPLGRRAAAWTWCWLVHGRPRVALRSTSLLFVSARGGALCERQLTKLGHDHIVRALGKERGSCHVFRHSAATVLLNAGADVRHVQELLGHDDIRTTQRYTHVAVRDLKAAHARFHPAA